MIVILHGLLAERFGREHRLCVATPAEAVRAMASNHRGWAQAIRAGAWRVVDRTRESVSMMLESGDLALHGRREVHIIPVVQGGKGGVFKVILGVALLATAFMMPASVALGGGLSLSASQIAWSGVMLMVGGAAEMMARPPQVSVGGYEARERPEERPSYLIGGAVNVMESGAAIPVVYGVREVGSVTISVGMHVGERA